ncbi:MAG TPA: HAD family phosphatase [Gaiellaceae bacterium]|nr:HAD family phosphatase [Gaiellaceae bacterium]
MAIRALLLDFNGTLSDDEPLLYAIFRELFDELGKPITEAEYYDQLAGLSDPEVVEKWLGEPDPAVVARKIERYRELSADGSTVSFEARRAVLEAARQVAVAVVSGSARSEIEPVLAAAGLGSSIAALVASEDVERGKPAPDGYLKALGLLGIGPDEAVAVEDSDVGIAAAKAAGLRCAAVSGTLPPDRLSAADEIIEHLDSDFVRRVLA